MESQVATDYTVKIKMSVLVNTSAGDLVVDLFVDDCPLASKNFIKLCKLKYYNNCLFYNVQQNFIAQTGDPTGTGKSGSSAYGLLCGDQSASFDDEISKNQKINKVGMVVMAHAGGKENTNRSQFFLTLRGEDMEQLESTHTIFGEVAEGLDVLEKINSLYCDEEGRPYQDFRIRHTYILDDPFPDEPQLLAPPSSPEHLWPSEEKVKRRIPYEEGVEDDSTKKTAEELDASIKVSQAKSRAIVLEMIGDIPDAEVKPPAEVLFVCKLNAVTTDEDLELIFSRFGTIKSCEVIRDFKTNDSLNYAFIEFETEAACIEAYNKMNNVLIDDRRIKVDFSQSVSKLWNRYHQQPRTVAEAAKTVKSVPLVAAPVSHYQRHAETSKNEYPSKHNDSFSSGSNSSSKRHLSGCDDHQKKIDEQWRNNRSNYKNNDYDRREDSNRYSDRNNNDNRGDTYHSRNNDDGRGEYSRNKRKDDDDSRDFHDKQHRNDSSSRSVANSSSSSSAKQSSRNRSRSRDKSRERNNRRRRE